MERERSQWDDLKSGLERKLRDAQALYDSLQAELAKVRSDNLELERKRGFDTEMQSQLDDLRRDNQQMEREFREQLEETQNEARQNEDSLLMQLNEARSK